MVRLALSITAALLLSSFTFAAEETTTATAPAQSSVAAAMGEAAQRLLASLSDEEKAVATMKFDDPKRLDWHNIPKPERKGLQFKAMSPAQKKLCLALIESALSPAGYEKAQRIMSLENNLREGEKGLPNGQLRDPERYFLTIFGEPAQTGSWGWSFEGHHFSLNFTVRDGQVISATPSFWGACPATVRVYVEGGPEQGVRTLGEEEQIGLDLVASLDEIQRREVVIADKAPAEYRAAGQPQPPHSAPEGVPASKMTDAQKKLLWTLLETYTGHLAPELAAAELTEVKEAGLNRIYFGWAGAQKAGEPHYFRIQGPTFVLELINVQADPAGNIANHIHSVWRSLKGDFGVAAK
ncbi:MAG TPA: DUF3500 domain-containing protein [Pirellulales bacterium]